MVHDTHIQTCTVSDTVEETANNNCAGVNTKGHFVVSPLTRKSLMDSIQEGP